MSIILMITPLMLCIDPDASSAVRELKNAHGDLLGTAGVRLGLTPTGVEDRPCPSRSKTYVGWTCSKTGFYLLEVKTKATFTRIEF